MRVGANWKRWRCWGKFAVHTILRFLVPFKNVCILFVYYWTDHPSQVDECVAAKSFWFKLGLACDC